MSRLRKVFMSTTKEKLAEWFDLGVKENADYMIVVCDTFDYSDYPVFTSEADFWNNHKQYDNQGMQKIMEIYDLRKDKGEQVNSDCIVKNKPTLIG